MADTKIDSFPLGAGKFIPVNHTGPASYTLGGETLGAINNMTGITLLGLSTIDMVLGSGALSVSGTYYAQAQPTGTGSRKTWKLVWLLAGNNQGVDSVVISTAGTGQTNGVSSVSGVGGGGTGATVQITIAGGLITNAVVTNPGSGYTSVPTFTVAQGGTPGTLTATVGAITGVQVPAGTNLSAETLNLVYVGR